jgi:DNA-directed RNA polymerase alpha subunit
MKQVKDDLEYQIEEIVIPEAVKNLPINYFDFSMRLENVLRRLNVELLGDLQEMSFDEIEHTRNCGRKTVDELHEFIEKLQDENSVEMLVANYQQRIEDFA